MDKARMRRPRDGRENKVGGGVAVEVKIYCLHDVRWRGIRCSKEASAVTCASKRGVLSRGRAKVEG